MANSVAIKVGGRARATKASRAGRFWPGLRAATTIAFLLLIGSNTLTGSSSYAGVGVLGAACPLGVAQLLAASRTILPALALAGVAGILLSVVFGRAFCAWLCPGRWIFNRGPAGKALPPGSRGWLQRAILASVAGAAWACRTPVFCVVCPAGVVCRGAIAAGTGGSILPTLGWLGVVLGGEWASGRSWCRDLCPLGTALGLISRFNPFLKFKVRPDRCVPCGLCQRACPEGLNPSKETDLSRCTKCFACQTACPRGAIELRLR